RGEPSTAGSDYRGSSPRRSPSARCGAARRLRRLRGSARRSARRLERPIERLVDELRRLDRQLDRDHDRPPMRIVPQTQPPARVRPQRLLGRVRMSVAQLPAALLDLGRVLTASSPRYPGGALAKSAPPGSPAAMTYATYDFASGRSSSAGSSAISSASSTFSSHTNSI